MTICLATLNIQRRPTLPGCFGNGQTIEEAKHSIRIAAQQHLETQLAHGEIVLAGAPFS